MQQLRQDILLVHAAKISKKLMLMLAWHARWLMVSAACRNLKALLEELMAIAEVTKGKTGWQLDLIACR